MTDLPPDVRATLSQLLGSVAAAARRREVDTARAGLDTVRRVTEHKVPAGPLAERLRHGCDRAEALAADEPLVAAEYAESMRERVGEG